MLYWFRLREMREREREGWEDVDGRQNFVENGVREESVLNLIVFAFFPRGKEISFSIL